MSSKKKDLKKENSLSLILKDIENRLLKKNDKKNEREISKKVANYYNKKEETIRSLWKYHKKEKNKKHENQILDDQEELY